MKSRFTSLDVRAITTNLEQLQGLRVSNIYDLSQKAYIIKPDLKKFLLVEAGVRIHCTEYERSKSVPSVFTMKLRKAIRTKRLESIK